MKADNWASPPWSSLGKFRAYIGAQSWPTAVGEEGDGPWGYDDDRKWWRRRQTPVEVVVLLLLLIHFLHRGFPV